MLIVVSPAKSLDYETPLATKKFSEPTMLDRSEELIGIMRTKTVGEIEKLMSISPSLAALNHERYHDWERPFTRKNARPAILAFNGDVYSGMQAPTTFSERDFTHSQKVLRILSGLYGLLRPLDLMMPYRLEMGTKLSNTNGKDLYAYWGGTITNALSTDVAASPGDKVLVNLASNEYFTAVRPKDLGFPVIAPAFLDSSNGKDYKIVSFFAKRARGAMAGWIIRDRVSTAKALRTFDGLGYRFDPDRSSTTKPVFVREGATMTGSDDD